MRMGCSNEPELVQGSIGLWQLERQATWQTEFVEGKGQGGEAGKEG